MWESICLTLAATAGNNIGKVLQKKGTVILPPLSFKLKACSFFSCLVWCCCLCCLVAQKGKENYRKLGIFCIYVVVTPFFFFSFVGCFGLWQYEECDWIKRNRCFFFLGLKEWGFWGWRLWLFPTFSWQPNGAAWLGSQKWKTCYSELWLFSGTFSATKLGISVKIWQNWIKVLYLLILSENYMESKPQINSLVHSYSW